MPEFKVNGRPYSFKVLDQEEQDRILAEFLWAQERDLYCHCINLERYDAMLRTLPEGEWRNRIAQLREETAKRRAEVESIIAATLPQLPPEPRLQAAIAKVKAQAQAREGKATL